jgi:AraC family transcriptional regulator
MKAETGEYYHQALAAMIEHVLRCNQGPIRIPDLANAASMSRFHLGRLFQEVTGDTLGRFLRRTRLERAAFALRTTDQSILEIAVDCGYRSGEALSRAFREAFGVIPSEFRKRPDLHWELPSPTDLHWNPHYGSDEHIRMPGVVSTSVVHRPSKTAVVWRWVGNYAQLATAWKLLETELRHVIPNGPATQFINLYRDNMWTHPVSNTMRADLGWIIEPNEDVPLGMRRITIPSGLYAVTDRFVARKERNDAWSYMSAIWASPRHRRKDKISMDEYAAWPLPFEEVQTRIVIGLAESN